MVEGVIVSMIQVGFAQEEDGAKVTSVSKGCPTEWASLEAGDLVKAIDGQSVSKVDEAMSRVGKAEIGRTM